MDDLLKAKWLKALRSGSYRQGRGRLYEYDKHDPFGVLCEILEYRKYKLKYSNEFAFTDGPEEFTTVLPDDLLNTIGIDPTVANQIIAMNDFDGANFGEVAQFIENSV